MKIGKVPLHKCIHLCRQNTQPKRPLGGLWSLSQWTPLIFPEEGRIVAWGGTVTIPGRSKWETEYYAKMNARVFFYKAPHLSNKTVTYVLLYSSPANGPLHLALKIFRL